MNPAILAPNTRKSKGPDAAGRADTIGQSPAYAGICFLPSDPKHESKKRFSGLVDPGDAGYTSIAMQTYHVETVVKKDGQLQLDHVPFTKGESVHVFVSSARSDAKRPLKGSVLKYERPFAPVAEGEWEAAK